MKLKYYGEYNDVNEAIEYYKHIFDLQVVKKTKHHGNVLLFGEISLLLHGELSFRQKPGYHIMKFEANEVDKYVAAVKKVKESNLVTINFEENNARWGTTFFEFVDKYGYNWDFEIDTDLLNRNV